MNRCLITFILFMILHLSPGFTEPVSEISDNTSQIYIDYNNKFTYERIRELTILKAADLALSQGYTHFEFMYSPDRPVVGSVERQGNILKDVYGNASESTFENFVVPTPVKNKSTILVRFCNENEKKCMGINAQNAVRNLHR